jgi:hypothetical protein
VPQHFSLAHIPISSSIKVEYADMIFGLDRNTDNRYRELKFALGISDRSVM